MNLPLLVKQSVILFPGQTLPMTVFNEQTIDMLRTCIQNNRTLGVVCLEYGKIVQVGTTAEIFECMYESPVQGFRLKAKGRQRFKILQVITQVCFETYFVDSIEFYLKIPSLVFASAKFYSCVFVINFMFMYICAYICRVMIKYQRMLKFYQK